MAGQNPNDVVVPGSIGAFDAEAAPWSWIPPDWMDAGEVDPMAPPIGEQQIALPGELAKHGVDPLPMPTPTIPIAGGPAPQPQPAPQPGPITPQPKSTLGPKGQHLGMPGAPTGDEVANTTPPFLDVLSAPAEAPAEPVLPPPAAPLQQATPASPDSLAPVDPYTGINSPDVNEATKAWTDLGEKDPEEFAKQSMLADDAKQQKQFAEEARVAREDAEREQDNLRAYQDSIVASKANAEQLYKDATDLANQKVDPDRWWNDRSTGQKIAGFISAIVGGLAQSAGGTGGRNVGLDMINKSIDDDIAAQTANLQNKRGALQLRQGIVADVYQRTGDLFRAQETARIASREQAVRDLEVKMGQYDPSGTTARRIAATIMQGRAQNAAAKLKYEQEDQKRQLELLKAAQDQQRIALQQQAQAETVRNNKAQTSVDWTRVAHQQKQFDKQYDLDQKKLDEEIAKRKAEGNTKEAKELAELGIGGVPTLELDDKGNPKVDFEGNPVLKYDVMRNDDGTPFKAPTSQEAVALRKKNSAVNTIQNAMADTIMLRKKYGWSSDLLKSPEWQKMKANWSTILVKQKDLQELGAISASDLELVKGLMGTADPTQAQDPLPGMVKAFDNTEATYNNDLRSLKYTGNDIHHARPWDQPAAVTSPDQVKIENILKFNLEKLPSDEFAQIGNDIGVPNKGFGSQYISDVASTLRDKFAGVPPSIRSQIDSLKTALNDPRADEKTKATAREGLQQIANSAEDKDIRAYALANSVDVGTAAASQLTPEEEPR